ncbi:hypothetical protein M513_00347 [Trichuris suis]|uniref:Uncharacterized protein n=1 Tax=Trichuris suis TaxID=68888 RepID=A0A085MN58_9BILA|nr:hypothetical protein M513_00347 [Trichuris suis]
MMAPTIRPTKKQTSSTNMSTFLLQTSFHSAIIVANANEASYLGIRSLRQCLNNVWLKCAEVLEKFFANGYILGGAG